MAVGSTYQKFRRPPGAHMDCRRATSLAALDDSVVAIDLGLNQLWLPFGDQWLAVRAGRQPVYWRALPRLRQQRC